MSLMKAVFLKILYGVPVCGQVSMAADTAKGAKGEWTYELELLDNFGGLVHAQDCAGGGNPEAWVGS
jgi:hypothetical protein